MTIRPQGSKRDTTNRLAKVETVVHRRFQIFFNCMFRQMYGRAGLDLLARRFLLSS